MTDEQKPLGREQDTARPEPGDSRKVVLSNGKLPETVRELLADGWTVTDVRVPHGPKPDKDEP